MPVGSAEDAATKARAILRTPIAASAVDLLWPGRLAVLFEGGRRGVEEQVVIVRAVAGGDEDESVWAEIEARQSSSRGRMSFDPGGLAAALGGLEGAAVRVSAGLAYVPTPVADRRDPAEIALAERVRAQFDPDGILA